MSATASGGHERGVEARRRGPRVPARLLRLASDERLVDALRGGSEAAFEVIYTRHHRGVLSFCRHMLGSVEEAEDAVQHTFLAAYRDLLRSDKPIHLRPWLYAIARNRCLSVLRARRERSLDAPIEPSTEHLAHEVERRHDLRALLGDLAELAPDQRAALVLAELGDMSQDEIGAVLGCPKEKVKALVFQARSSLIASRTARDTSCAEIREQLANLRGGSLRRNTLRRHLRECPGCRDYRDQVHAQRGALALILPVAPTFGLKAAVLGAAGRHGGRRRVSFDRGHRDRRRMRGWRGNGGRRHRPRRRRDAAGGSGAPARAGGAGGRSSGDDRDGRAAGRAEDAPRHGTGGSRPARGQAAPRQA